MKPESGKKIHHSFISEGLEELLLEIIAKEKWTKALHISPYNRYGNSGSNLYKISFSEKESGGVPYLLKTFEDKRKFSRELKGMEQFKRRYEYSENFTPYQCKLSGILLKNHNKKPDKVNNPLTLMNIMYIKSESKICRIIDKTFNDFNNIYRTELIKDCDIKEMYKRYLRGDKTRSIIAKLTTDSISEKKIGFYEQRITNPVYIMDNLKENMKIKKSLIHGDFHQNNIVMNDNNEPRIIDFAWSGMNDIYIDFSLLEMSVRYWNPPFFTDYKTKKDLERIFLSENIDSYIDASTVSQNVRRMLVIVREIRRWCKYYIKDYNFEHHLLSQFLILYGLQAYTNEYNPFLVVPFLAKLGDKLMKSGYVNEA